MSAIDTKYANDTRDTQLTGMHSTAAKDNVQMTERIPTILVIDDEWMNRELMEALLESAGYQVLLAGNSEKGMQIATAQQPDLVLVDVRLRYDTEGYDFCRQIKRTPETSSIRVAILTAMESEADRRAAQAAGADDFISRMLDTPVLLERIAALLK
jgi:CheY-like chemotaxis protein